VDVVSATQADNSVLLEHSTLFQGSAETILPVLPDSRFRTCVTSPPYWGLRDYAEENQIGAEPEPALYIERLTAIFDQVRRVLRDDGTLWLNLGDSYTSGNRATRAPDKKNPVRAMNYRARTPKGMKPKDLVGIPWMVAFALRDAGWYFRSDIIWEKPNCMPESVKDRPTRSHEYMFLFAKSLRYHYDSSKARVNGRNRRTVWSVPTEAFSGAHFATFPPTLIEPCILTGSIPGDWVLDPFFGSGTVGVVCEQQRRKYVGIELNPAYAQLAAKRIRLTERTLFTLDYDTAQ
jgi:site-specific DNA-methyltransferase (adenine-specific)